MCDEITEIAFNNLELLYNLKKDDNLVSNRKVLSINDKTDEYVQVDNINDIEYSFYFTFMRIFNLRGFDYLDNRELYKKIDNAIDNIYNNEKLNEMIEKDTELKNMLEDIDELYSYYSNERSYDIYDNFLKNVEHKYKLIVNGINYYYQQFQGYQEYVKDKKHKKHLHYLLKHEIIEYIEKRSDINLRKHDTIPNQ